MQGSMLENILDALPDYAKDIRINLKSLLLSETLPVSQVQAYEAALACSFATGNKTLSLAVEKKVLEVLSKEQIDAAKAAGTIMSMNNVYYRFLHIAKNKDYAAMPAGLRMNVMTAHGTSGIDFEMASFAVSVINGCGGCIDSHEAKLLKDGVTTSQIQYLAKLGAVINALSKVLPHLDINQE